MSDGKKQNVEDVGGLPPTSVLGQVQGMAGLRNERRIRIEEDIMRFFICLVCGALVGVNIGLAHGIEGVGFFNIIVAYALLGVMISFD